MTGHAWWSFARRRRPVFLKTLRPAALLLLPLLPLPGVPATRAEEPPATARANPAAPWEIHADEPPDFADPLAVFAFLFHRLPDEVRVLPTENYYYWRLRGGGRELRGNFRLASGLRERGTLSFAAEEWTEPHDAAASREPLKWAARLGAARGVRVTCPDALSAVVEFQGKRVRFQLHAIPQLPPPPGVLADDEVFVARTFDESGLPFYLCFHRPSRRFFWILNEEQPLPETFSSPAPGVLAGRRTGFLFWRDDASPARRRTILAGVSRENARRNNEYDGPFDQLADNYAAQVPLKKYLEIAYPGLKGRVDQYGYLTESGGSARVAITGYLLYEKPEEVFDLLRLPGFSLSPVATIAAAGEK